MGLTARSTPRGRFGHQRTGYDHRRPVPMDQGFRIKYDQLIQEFDQWVHVSYSDKPRGQCLRAVKQEGKTISSLGDGSTALALFARMRGTLYPKDWFRHGHHIPPTRQPTRAGFPPSPSRNHRRKRSPTALRDTGRVNPLRVGA